ncbi:hypothetical protein N8I77_000778 [Diaporthe amygdali]|uniref:Zn(2)-C6 fungal-type domain-containing protein n=1 Tax=Phomopsis amygdali TaxID=1214568 RepID=A0AAD9WA49_PHOAM|nr:hypothetical protein N8I77_000778 [Diaporthe amygdali]
MDAFLLDAPDANHACASVEDLALQLASLRGTKATDTKAEHISATFEFRSTVVFKVPESENDTADPAQNPDQPLGGTPGAVPIAPINGNTAATMREIRANDTLMNQPSDDPALQKLVAKHIIASLGSVDGSSWTVRSVSRKPSGWTFTYLCRNSTQAWMRQNSKHSAKLRIAESSGKDGQDPVNLSRPAFDCRGSVTIAFVKSNRIITVKLEHTPLHKTVAELAELFKPPPPLPRAEAARRKDGERRKRNSQADGVHVPEESPKKRKKKDASTGGQVADGEQVPKPKKPRASRAKKLQNVVAQPQEDAQNSALLNISPLETARRQDEASKKLRDNGVDPATLSSEQFNIFANQSPDLQMESLAMLVKYGAERLRIVHPNREDAPQSGSPDSANGDASNASAKKKTSRKKAPREDGVPKVKKTRGSCQACRAKKIKATKPECQECVRAGIACYFPPPQKRKPVEAKSAEVAEDEPEEPEAAPLPVSMPEPMPDHAPAPEPVPEAAPEEEEASDLGSPGFNTSHPPAPEVMSHPAETTGLTVVSQDVSQDLYHPAPTGLSYPQGVGVPEDMSTSTGYFQAQSTSNGIAYPQQPQQTSHVAYTDTVSAPRQHVPEPEPVPAPVHPVQEPSQTSHPTSSRPGTRRSLPSGSSQNQIDYASSTDAAPVTSSWQATNVPADAGQAYSEAQIASQSAPARPNRSMHSAAPPAYDTSTHETLQAATTLTQAALQRKPHASPTTRTSSPFQNPTQAAKVARAKSRQSQRSQSRQTASPFQQSTTAQLPQGGAASSLYNAPPSTDSSNLPSYDPYSRYSTTPAQAPTTSSRVAYEPYSQQAASNTSTASYPGYDAYTSRSQTSNTPLANPVTQSASTAAPSSKNWASSSGRRGSNSYGSNKATTSSTSAYSVPASSAQQQSTAMQSFNVRPQSTAPTQSRTTGNTPASFTQQPRRQQQQQQQQQQPAYSSYSSQPHPNTDHQQQQQQDWYGLGSANNAASNYGPGSYSQHRSMNLTGNNCTSMNDQEALYEMLRNNPRH